MIQFRTQGKIAKNLITESSADQAQIISNLYDANVALRKEVDDLDRQLRNHAEISDQARAGELAADLQKFRIVNGAVPVLGPGIELTIAADVRSEDIIDLINELRNAGAETLALNGVRVTFRSAVRSQHGTIVLDNQELMAPYVFTAIGAPEILERALTRKGGLVSYLQTTYPEGRIDVAKSSRLSLPSAVASASFQVAVPEKGPG
jgi:uncharacterized protein YlxW (UPF0749 family)